MGTYTLELVDDRLYRLKEVKDRVGTSVASLYRWMDEGIFPRPIQIGPKAVRWSGKSLRLWLESRGF